MRREKSWFPGDADHAWIESIGRPIHVALAALEREAQPGDIPILDRESGRALSALVADRRRIVEVGTAIGYSTLWMALGQPADGTIVTIDPDASRTDVARRNWRSAGIADARIRVVNAPALDAFRAGHPDLAGPFDLAFIDAVKEEYAAYLEALIPRLVPGALLLADNVLWGGRTSGARPERPGDGTEPLRAFCVAVLADPRFTGTILPVGDGLLMAAFRP